MSVDEHLRAEQYRDASNLYARIALHEQFSTNPHGLPLWIFDQLELADEARILEIGCGIGSLSAENTKRIPKGWQITLTDAPLGMVCEAQQREGLSSLRLPSMWGASAECASTRAPLWRTRAAPEPTWSRSWWVKIMRLRSRTPVPASIRAAPIASA
jgi:hypothetical protein